MRLLASRTLCLVAALCAFSYSDDLPLEEWNERIDQLESLELVYEFEDREGPNAELVVLIEAPGNCYLRAGDDVFVWLVDGRMWSHIRTDGSWTTNVANLEEIVLKASGWSDELAGRLPHNHQFSSSEIRTHLNFWPNDSELGGIRFDLQLLALDGPLFAWMNEHALDAYDVERVADGFELTDDDGLRVLLDSNFGLPTTAWRTVDDEEREVLSLERIAIDEGVEFPEVPEDAEDNSIQIAQGLWVVARARAYNCLWTRAHVEDIEFEDSERELVVESFRELHSQGDEIPFAQNVELYRQLINERLSQLQALYDEAREREDSGDEIDEEVRPTIEPDLRNALIELRDQYSAPVVAPEVRKAADGELDEFLELELEGARLAFDEAVLEPLIDYLLEELEHVG